MFAYNIFIAFTRAFYMFAYSILSISFAFTWVLRVFAYEIFVAFIGAFYMFPYDILNAFIGHSKCLPAVS